MARTKVSQELARLRHVIRQAGKFCLTEVKAVTGIVKCQQFLQTQVTVYFLDF